MILSASRQGRLTVTRDAAGAGSFASGGEADTFDGIEGLILGSGSDTFTGGTGDDIVRGYLGADSLSGGDGSDVFQVASGDGLDSVDGGNGTDTIQAQSAATITWTSLNVSGIEAVNGGGFANVVLGGTALADTMDFSGVSLTGITRIDGGVGNDTITGSAGADTIVGGAGTDLLTGGGGADTFRFSTGQSTVVAPDHITDFSGRLGDGDKIDLSLIDANSAVAGVQLFHWVDAAAFVASDAGTLRAYDDGLGHTVIEGNINADTTADFRIVLDNAYAIGSGDFIGVL